MRTEEEKNHIRMALNRISNSVYGIPDAFNENIELFKAVYIKQVKVTLLEEELMKNLIIISDIHSNMTALKEVRKKIEELYPNKDYHLIILGDVIDYGPSTMETLKYLSFWFLENGVAWIKGNHEEIMINDQELNKLSSERGKESALLTKSELTPEAINFLKLLKPRLELDWRGYTLFLTHGCPNNNLWGNMLEYAKNYYNEIPYYSVFVGGHTHKPGFEIYEHSKIFVNSGSIGQPRDNNPEASFVELKFNPGTTNLPDVYIHRVKYNIEEELSKENLRHQYYKERLIKGI